jgi:hypothetical protein
MAPPMVSAIQTGNAFQTSIPDRWSVELLDGVLGRLSARPRAPDRRRRPEATRFACRIRAYRDARWFCMNSTGCAVAGNASPARGRFAYNLLREAPRPKRIGKNETISRDVIQISQ